VAQEPPPTIQMLVAEDNSRLDEWTKQVQQIRVRNIYMYTSLIITYSPFQNLDLQEQNQRDVKKVMTFVDFSML
jgi:hypothetical protein